MKTDRRVLVGTCGQLAVTLAAGAVVLGAAIVSPRKAEGTQGAKVTPVSVQPQPGKTFPPELTVGELHVAIKEWDVPTKGAHPHDPAVGMDGALWFTEQMQNKIGRVEPSTGVFKEFPLKVDNSGPHGLVADAEGSIWFTGNFAHYIGKLDPKTGEVKEYKMPDAKAED